MKTIAESWRTFEQAILDPINASPVQRQEMKRAFYAGAQALMAVVLTNLGPESEPTEADMLAMDAIELELKAFANAVGKGWA